MLVPSLLSLQVAIPCQVQTPNGPLRTALAKQPVTERIALGPRALAGDGCADLVHHGLIDQAVCVYPQEHYQWWREHLGLNEDHFPYGSFGENFTVAGQTEESAYLGDRYRIGTAVVEITKPRQPCSTLNKVWGEPQLAAQMGRRALTGWYLRVLEPGQVQAGDLFELLDRSAKALSVAEDWKSQQNRSTP
ncbi:MAG: MOSC domain-containing protein [Planctomycetes bacterium]|nr:MOSC domain-containing protein [Planctomycetota bacterium]MCP4771958.1 MOSC domain-containing protein [Planctomycetota bacterium]MCP4860391.1 MOSC domain-containing protein [Planctomycetota bacterium]